jgi:hypothetical protein
MRKFRTLRHPGVLKVLDTIEVGDYHERASLRLAGLCVNRDIDRVAHLHCDGAGRPFVLGCQEEESERGNDKMGSIYRGG